MVRKTYLALTRAERSLLEDALLEAVALRHPASVDMIKLTRRIRRSANPKITVAVEDGMVQRISGNPFPVRICDYDINGIDPECTDEFGRPCVISFAPEDESRKASRYTVAR